MNKIHANSRNGWKHFYWCTPNILRCTPTKYSGKSYGLQCVFTKQDKIASNDKDVTCKHCLKKLFKNTRKINEFKDSSI